MALSSDHLRVFVEINLKHQKKVQDLVNIVNWAKFSNNIKNKIESTPIINDLDIKEAVARLEENFLSRIDNAYKKD